MGAIVRNICAGTFAANSTELPAVVFLTYFTTKSAFRTFGFGSAGTITVYRAIADEFVRRGGELWLSAEVEQLRFDDDGRIRSIAIRRDEKPVEVGCQFVVSNIGPKATVALCGTESMPADYLRQVDDLRPCPFVTINFATRTPLKGFDGVLTFGRTRRLCAVTTFAICPEMSPPGWFLHVGWGVPVPSDQPFDDELEIDLTLEDLREKVPEFCDAKIVSVKIMKDAWPGQRAMAGSDLSIHTPVENLWNVGDGVKEYADGGMEACARSALRVVDEVTRRHGPVSAPIRAAQSER